jgi:1,4-alpha-glucan branching enzyme
MPEMTARPSFCAVLHAHIPYVLGHGRWPHGSDWLCEAAVETYLPLLRAASRLADAGRGPHLTVGISPILCEQLASRTFQDELRQYLELKIEAARRDEAEFLGAHNLHASQLALSWQRYFERAERDFEALGWDLVGAFRRLLERGAIEILGSSATHAYLPLLGRQSAIRAQLRAGLEAHRKHFGVEPRGFWLPECAYRPAGVWQSPLGQGPPSYRPGLEDFLALQGYQYFVVDTHLVDGAMGGYWPAAFADRTQAEAAGGDGLFTAPPRPPTGQPAAAGASPYRCYRVGPVAVWVRDPLTSKLVWSAREGYPGDDRYLEFHKRRHPGGLRYWRITRQDMDLGEKAEYDELAAQTLALSQAEQFTRVVRDHLLDLRGVIEAPVLVAPYDAELFGHWWFEGTTFLAQALERLSAFPDLTLSTLEAALASQPPTQEIALPEGSWGAGGGHDTWFNASTSFVWRLVYEAEEKLESLVRSRVERAGRLELRVLRQLARTLLLLEASDWPFLITTRTARDYAERRVLEHYEDFKRLYAAARHLGSGGAPAGHDLDMLETLERTDAVFPEVDPAWWR